jgi:AraC-like DNA-binding protein
MPYIDTASTHNRTILDLQGLGIRDVPAVGRHIYRAAHEELIPHNHGPGIMEISYLESGKQLYSVGGQDYTMNGGDVFVTFPDETHSTGGYPEERGVMYWMFVWLPESQAPFLNVPQGEVRGLLDGLTHLDRRLFPGSPSLKSLLDKIFTAYRQQDDALRVVNIKNYLMRYLLDVMACGQQDLPSTISPIMARVLEAMEAGVDESFPLQKWADIAGLSLSRFKTRFKQEVGISPADYMLRQKIDCAKEMLRCKTIPITDLALDLGFSSSQYFASVFKRYTGRTPSAYRKGTY